MKKVFLIDDEILIREGIRNHIAWHNEGFNFCGDAADGEIALPLIEKEKPDILITDIQMPFMDGLQVSRIIRQKMPWIKIIILSGHDEFHYAKEAISIGVMEYVLKPFSSSDLLRLLHKVAKQIDLEQSARDQLEELQNQNNNRLRVSQERFFNDLCLGTLTPSEAIEMADALQLDVISKYYMVIITEYELLKDNQSAETYGNIRDHLMIKLKHVENLFYFQRSIKETVWIYKRDDVNELEALIPSFINPLKSDIEKKYPCVFNVGVGGIKERIRGISLSFAEADKDKIYQTIKRKNPSFDLNEQKIQDVMRFEENLGLNQSIVEQAKDYIVKHYDQTDLSLKSVSAHVNVSPSYFSAMFSQETGQTFINYLTRTRINRAMELLTSTKERSYNIAYMVGYNDPHYFSNTFKKVTGLSPMAFRRQGSR
ncbi:two-component system response regulator YesN [Scopulibacillus darangshiensis]|uniref:Two-component system response regulator YesN n=1 Tax=Scopulibacillus darangshiensis TaxID=442528 RepID=A0A4R2P441_9BACL|nr:response regulator [Scopulibacillus darangshiensis]TCP29560.1 two-component system response regulator YesN [Scopulibacillus darangshiensis]